MASGSDKTIKAFFERIVSRVMMLLARAYLRLKKPTLVVVAGSIGKTSTKMMIGQLLSSHRKAGYMGESYNSGLGLAMSVFQETVPRNLLNPLSWVAVFTRATFKFFVKGPEVMVLEYGIAHPGDMRKHLKLAKPDITVLTAISPEHMEYMQTIEAVAEEEMAPVKAARDKAFINEDDVEARFWPRQTDLFFYGSGPKSIYRYRVNKIDIQGARVVFDINGVPTRELKLKLIAEYMIRQMAGAAGVAYSLGVPLESIEEQLEGFESVPGRMRLLAGVNQSVLLDDTANFSPVAGIAAMKTLKMLDATRRIVVFGNQHELGDYERQGFSDVSKEFKDIDLFVFIGALAKKYFAPEAEKLGHKLDASLFVFDDSISAGKFLKSRLKSGDVVLLKGPFGGFYVEECTKQLLARREDVKKLARQSDFWIRKKSQHFGKAFEEYPKV